MSHQPTTAERHLADTSTDSDIEAFYKTLAEPRPVLVVLSGRAAWAKTLRCN